MHALIVFPYYFFAALNLAVVLVLLTRLLRLKVSINTLVTTSVVVSLVAMILVMSHDEISARDLKGGPMLVMAIVSFVLAGLDALLKKSLPHQIDQELDVEM